MGLPTAFLAALLALAPAQSAPPAPRMSEAESASVQTALDRGALIYAYDRAAWHATDDLTAKLPDYQSRVGGWIVDGPADAPQIVFYDQDAADPHAVYVADFHGGALKAGRLLAAGDDRALSPQRKAMIAAVRAATQTLVKAKTKACKSRPFNTVVLPPASAGAPTLVYFLTPQTENGAIPMGGHYRVEVGADGRAAKPRPFTKACMEMPVQDARGARPEALVITHLLDPTPTEIHVFSSRAARLPIFVMTKGARLWSVDGNRIRLHSAGPGR